MTDENECTCVGCKKKLEEIAKNEDADRVVCFCGQRNKLGGIPLVITINRLNKKQGDADTPKPETNDEFTQVTPTPSSTKPKKKKKRCTIL
nr:unnamed protein product [Callosobruchus analis]